MDDIHNPTAVQQIAAKTWTSEAPSGEGVQQSMRSVMERMVAVQRCIIREAGLTLPRLRPGRALRFPVRDRSIPTDARFAVRSESAALHQPPNTVVMVPSHAIGFVLPLHTLIGPAQECKC